MPCWSPSGPGRTPRPPCARLPASAGRVQPQMLSPSLRRVLEVGSGSGYVITSVQRMLRKRGRHAACWATDLNPEAARATRTTVAAHQVRMLGCRARAGADLCPLMRCCPVQGRGGPALQLCRAHGGTAAGLRGPAGEREQRCVHLNACSGRSFVTCVAAAQVFNPPYVPTPPEEVGTAMWCCTACAQAHMADLRLTGDATGHQPCLGRRPCRQAGHRRLPAAGTSPRQGLWVKGT